MKSISQQYQTAVQYFNTGEFPEAERICRTIIDQDSTNSDAAHLLAIVLYHEGILKEALAFVNLAIKTTQQPQFYNTKGNILADLNHYQDAEDTYHRSLLIAPQQIEGYKNLAILLRNTGRADEAIVFCDKALKINPKDVSTLNSIGLCHFDLEQYDKASDFFKNAIAIAPGYLAAQINLARSWYALHKTENAIQHIQHLLTQQPDNLQIRKALGDMFRDEKNYTDAALQYRKILNVNSGDFDAINSLGVCLLELGKVEEAGQQFQRALTLRANDINVLLNLCIYFSLKQDYQSIIHFINHYTPQSQESDAYQLYIYSAIHYWLIGNRENVETALRLAKAGVEKSIPKKVKDFSKAYYTYLLAMCQQMEPLHPDSPEKIYVIGDSHSLVCNQRPLIIKGKKYWCESRLVIGCKIWHLIQEQENRFRYSLNRVIEMLPEKSRVVFNFGEIDCRVDEGIILQLKKSSKSISEICETMASQYVEIIESIAEQKSLIAFVMGIPAPCIKSNCELHSDQLVRIKIIKQMNYALKNYCNKKGLITFIDTYAITRDHFGSAGPGFHLDEYHLCHSVYQIALDQIA